MNQQNHQKLEGATAGGVLYDPRGQIESTHSWNIGPASNNQAEAYALLQSLLIAKSKNIEVLYVVGDSKNTIRHLKLFSLPTDAILRSIFLRIHGIINEFNQVFLWHIRRDLNSLLDELANKGINGENDSLTINGKQVSTLFLSPFSMILSCVPDLWIERTLPLSLGLSLESTLLPSWSATGPSSPTPRFPPWPFPLSPPFVSCHRASLLPPPMLASRLSRMIRVPPCSHPLGTLLPSFSPVFFPSLPCVFHTIPAHSLQL
jgi:ribonuclease HI